MTDLILMTSLEMVNALFENPLELLDESGFCRVGEVPGVASDSDLAVVTVGYHTNTAAQVASPRHQIVKFSHLQALKAPRFPGTRHTAKHAGVIGAYVVRSSLHVVPQQRNKVVHHIVKTPSQENAVC